MADKKKFSSISDIKGTSVKRLVTGLPELNWLYGNTRKVYGIPEKTISVWSGPGGTGKSRLAIQTTKSLFSINQNWTILYFQGEVPLENFASYVGADPMIHRNLFVSDEFELSSIESSIEELRPNVVFIDSVNKIYDFKKHGGDYLIDGCPEDNILGLREVCNRYNCIVIMLGQVNQDGSNKGGTSLTHAVDIHLSFLPVKDDKDKFRVEIGEKNRYGKKSPWAIFSHNKDGVFEVTENRFYDEDWCTANGLKVRSSTVDNSFVSTELEEDEDLKNLKAAFIAFSSEENKSRPVKKSVPIAPKQVKKTTPIAPNRVNKSSTKDVSVGNHNISMKKRGFFGRLFRKMYKNSMYGCSKSINPMGYDYEAMFNNGDLEFEDMLHVQAYQDMINSPQYNNQQLADQIAANQEELTRRTISQGMTWLVPRFEDKLDEISQKIKKDW